VDKLALITIGGVAIPTPTEYTIGVMDISKAERNANGNMIIERITTKRKISISYAFLTASSLKTILTAISPTFYNVTYLDPVNNTFVTSSFYAGDRNMGMIDFQDGVARYKDVSFDLVER
jgi:hypothetical protein